MDKEEDATYPEDRSKERDDTVSKKEFERLYCRYVVNRDLVFYFAGIIVGIAIASFMRGD